MNVGKHGRTAWIGLTAFALAIGCGSDAEDGPKESGPDRAERDESAGGRGAFPAPPPADAKSGSSGTFKPGKDSIGGEEGHGADRGDSGESGDGSAVESDSPGVDTYQGSDDPDMCVETTAAADVEMKPASTIARKNVGAFGGEHRHEVVSDNNAQTLMRTYPEHAGGRVVLGFSGNHGATSITLNHRSLAGPSGSAAPGGTMRVTLTARSSLAPWSMRSPHPRESVFVDDDGTAYLLFVSDADAKRQNTHLSIAPLTDGYLGVGEAIHRCGDAEDPDGKKEAPSIIKYDGWYYLFASDTEGYESSRTSYKRARKLDEFPCTGGDNGRGWLTVRTDPSSSDSFDTQHDFIITVRGTEATTYVYAGDRWTNMLRDPQEGIDFAELTPLNAWFPLTFGPNGAPRLHGLSAWTLDVETGRWGQ